MKCPLARTALCLMPLTLFACSSDEDTAGSSSTGGGGGTGGTAGASGGSTGGGTAGTGGGTAGIGGGTAGTGGGSAGSGGGSAGDGGGSAGDGGAAGGGSAGEAGGGTGGVGGSPFPDWPATGLSDPELSYPACTPAPTDVAVSRARYLSQLHGFWLAECIANWTGLVTEMDKVGGSTLPFYTDDDWGTVDRPNIWGGGGPPATIDWVFTDVGAPWGADDDTDIEYIYQDLLDVNNVSILSGEQIRDGWLSHMSATEENYLWVSNQSAFDLMNNQGLVPPDTSEPANNPDYEMIDAQLTTEIHGLFAPARPDIALQMAHLPIRTTAKDNAEWISEFYVIMHSLASYVDRTLRMQEQVFWLADQARGRLPVGSFAAGMYDFVKAEYEANPDQDNWEATRDAVYQRYQLASNDGYVFQNNFDAGINFASSLVSLFYGEGDLPRTLQIGVLCGWDSDNPTATWGGLIGFMLGQEGVEQAFNKTDFSDTYWIGRTRINFPDRTPDAEGDDSFPLMAERGLYIIDRVVLEEIGGCVDLENDVWYIPDSGGAF